MHMSKQQAATAQIGTRQAELFTEDQTNIVEGRPPLGALPLSLTAWPFTTISPRASSQYARCSA